MSIRNANGLIVVQCDIPGCGEKWQTYSVRSVAREQARIHAGFTRERLSAYRGWEEWGKGSRGAKEIDCCKGHKPVSIMDASKPTTEGGSIAR